MIFHQKLGVNFVKLEFSFQIFEGVGDCYCNEMDLFIMEGRKDEKKVVPPWNNNLEKKLAPLCCVSKSYSLV